MPDPSLIRIVGARHHNLKNISVDIPRNKLTVISGLSGSGKSSLAFDTIYAEGQRCYVESLSIRARQFLEQLPKPDVDRIEGLIPTIAIEQGHLTASPRSTVATISELYDFFRVLYARVGQPHCWKCNRPIHRQTASQIVDLGMALPEGFRLVVLAPLVHEKRGDHALLLTRLEREGFVRVRLDGHIQALEDLQSLDAGKVHTIEAVVDRLVLKPQVASRLTDSIELALRLSGGRVVLSHAAHGDGPSRDQRYSSLFACADHPGVSLPELSPRLFSFNSPHGSCPQCTGLGTALEFDPELIVPDINASLSEGAITAWRQSGRRMTALYEKVVDEFCQHFGVSPDLPFKSIPVPLRRFLLEGTSKKDQKEHGAEFEGVIPNLRRRWESSESDSVKRRLHAFLSELPCTACHGGRLCQGALSVRIDQTNLPELCSLSIQAARRFLEDVRFDGEQAIIAEPILREIRQRLGFLCDVGVEYLTLDRKGASLSGGEGQRLRLATQIGGGLSGVCYVLDEPTIGLHQHDAHRLTLSLKNLTDMGNTVIVVEHDEEVMRAADHLIDVGPGAGAHGGQIMAQGNLEDILAAEESITGQYLSGRAAIPCPQARRPMDEQNCIRIEGATAHNLKNIDVSFPLGMFVCVTGVSGSGKSTLVSQILLRALRRALTGSGTKPECLGRIEGVSRIDRIIEVDQSPIGRSPRSNPATYVGVFDQVRKLYAQTREAKIRGYQAGRFSFNIKGGRCEHCQGQGTKQIEMHFLPDVFVSCEACSGKRYNRDTLDIRYRGQSIADVLDMRIESALEFFSSFPRIEQPLRSLMDVGLGYMTLGQASNTLSGGEAQRVKLAAELGKTAAGHTIYILDEPTTGLHAADVHQLLDVLNRLVEIGHSVVVIEHNLDVIKSGDWVIDLGPEGGDGGGYVVAEGTPEQLAESADSYTGQFLAARFARSAVTETRSVHSPLRTAARKP